MPDSQMILLVVAVASMASGYALRAMVVAKSTVVLASYHQGKADALSDWSVVVGPYRDHNEGWFSDRVAIGYTMQINYKGFPVGDSTVKIVDIHKKVDKERVEQVIQMASSVAQEVVKGLASRSLNAQFRI